MDFGKAFTFVFDDPDWLKKVAINALIGLIPFVGQLYLLGWGLEVARRVAMRSGTPLPDVDFSTHLGHGFRAFVLSLVYTIPIWVVILPMIVVIAIADAAALGRDARDMIEMVCGLCAGLILLVYAVVLAFAMPAALTRAVVRGSIRAGLEVREVVALVRAAPGAYLLTLVGTLIASLLASVVGGIACGIGIIFTMAYSQLVMGHFYGQAYLEAGGTA